MQNYIIVILKLQFLQEGQYTATVTSSSPSPFDVIITSKPTSTSAEVIRPIVRLSTKTLDFRNTTTLPVIYVYLRKGESPVKKATVQAIVESPNSIETCVLNLLDNGVGKWVISNVFDL